MGGTSSSLTAGADCDRGGGVAERVAFGVGVALCVALGVESEHDPPGAHDAASTAGSFRGALSPLSRASHQPPRIASNRTGARTSGETERWMAPPLFGLGRRRGV